MRTFWLLACLPGLACLAYILWRTGLQLPLVDDGADYLRTAQNIYRYQDWYRGGGLGAYLQNLYWHRVDHGTLLYPFFCLLFFPLVNGDPQWVHYLVTLSIYFLIGANLFRVFVYFQSPRQSILPIAALLSLPWFVTRIQTNESELFFCFLILGCLAEVWHPDFPNARLRAVRAGIWFGISLCARPLEALFSLGLFSIELLVRSGRKLPRANFAAFLFLAFVIPSLWFGPVAPKTFSWIYETLWGTAREKIVIGRTYSVGQFALDLVLFFHWTSLVIVVSAILFGHWRKFGAEQKKFWWLWALFPIQALVGYLCFATFTRRFIFSVFLGLTISFLVLRLRPRLQGILSAAIIALNLFYLVWGKYILHQRDICRSLYPAVAREVGVRSDGYIHLWWFETEASADFYPLLYANCVVSARHEGRLWGWTRIYHPVDVKNHGVYDFVILGPFFDKRKTPGVSAPVDHVSHVRTRILQDYSEKGDQAFPFAKPFFDDDSANPKKFFLIRKTDIPRLLEYFSTAAGA